MMTKALLACGAIAGPLFVVSFLVQGATRANYNPLRHPVSALSLGELGWTQATTFLVTGSLTLAFAAGLWRALRPRGSSRWGPLLVALCAVGLIGAGLFLTDPLSGYPPGTPGRPESRSVSAAAHDRFSALFFVGLPAACLVLARHFARSGNRRWAIYSATTAALFALAFVLASVGFSQVETMVAFGGLFQRIALLVGEGWLTLLALHLLRTIREERPAAG
jgi:hypothetical membrane protein